MHARSHDRRLEGRRARAGRRALHLALLVVTLAAASAGMAMEDEGEASPARDARRLGFGLHVGYGLGVAPRESQRGRDVEDVRFVAVNPQLRWLLARPGEGGRWYHGDLDGIVEASFLIETQPTSGWAGGVNFDLRYRFLRDASVQPYIEVGVGVGSLDFGLTGQDDGLSFVLQAGAGARIRLDERFSLIGGIRWHHISNAQLRQPNNGIDDILFLVGVELW